MVLILNKPEYNVEHMSWPFYHSNSAIRVIAFFVKAQGLIPTLFLSSLVLFMVYRQAYDKVAAPAYFSKGICYPPRVVHITFSQAYLSARFEHFCWGTTPESIHPNRILGHLTGHGGGAGRSLYD